jgi:hypothetical protein
MEITPKSNIIIIPLHPSGRTAFRAQNCNLGQMVEDPGLMGNSDGQETESCPATLV